jgi:SARP family transcriptional regulator, regulator of embCAB operon
LAAASTRIQLCGRVVIEIDGRRLEEALPGRQGLLLFAFLAARRDRAAPREALMDALWPEHARPGAADSALSALLSKLRSALGEERVAGRGEVRLVLPAGAFVDLEAAREAIHSAESAIARNAWVEAWAPARIALHVANRGFLPNHDLEWVDDTRRELADVQVRALECVAAAGLGLGGPELDAAIRSGRRMIEIAPYRESGYRHLMEALERRDDVAEALLVYDQLRQRLREDLAIAPGEGAQEIHRRLLERRLAS